MDGESHERRTRELARNRIRLWKSVSTHSKDTRGKLQRDALSRRRAPGARRNVFNTPSRAQSKLAESLGCLFGRNGGVLCGQYEATSVPGVFVAGNIIR